MNQSNSAPEWQSSTISQLLYFQYYTITANSPSLLLVSRIPQTRYWQVPSAASNPWTDDIIKRVYLFLNKYACNF